jgi:hypothetical protein
MDTFTDDIINNSIMQFRKRQITLSFTYRFNKQKSEKEKSKRDNEGGDSGDFPG